MIKKATKNYIAKPPVIFRKLRNLALSLTGAFGALTIVAAQEGIGLPDELGVAAKWVTIGLAFLTAILQMPKEGKK